MMDINITAEQPQEGTIYPLGVTPAELALWKKQHHEVVFIRVKDDQEATEIGAWFKMPTLDIIRLVQATAKQHSELDALEDLYNHCQLKVSPQIEAVTQYKLSLFQKLDVLLKTYEAEVLKF